MTKTINITIENELAMGQRDMNIYHHSTRSAHMISYNSSVTLPLKSVVEDDYLHISIVSGPGRLKNRSIVNLPSWIDFDISSADDVSVTHSGDRTILKIPPGLPRWQLKMTRSSSIDQQAGCVTISDDSPEFR
jgi:hypothetical protein